MADSLADLTTVRRSRLQISMFQLLFKQRLAEHGIEIAFASAIADSSDAAFEQCLKDNPEQIQTWLDRYGKRESKK